MSGHARPLTRDERSLARSAFGDAINLDRVTIANRKWWPFQPRNVTMAPLGHIHFHPAGGLYCDDFSRAEPAAQGLFIHELVHVWQHQQGVFLPIARHPFCAYRYRLVPGKPFSAYGVEQQAEIVRHAWMLRSGWHIPGLAPLSAYTAILPFSPIMP